MKTNFSNKWKSSKQPRKQRKYRYHAPNHIRGRFITSHLSKELRDKYKRRKVRIKKGDKIKVLRGQHKNKEGKVERIDVKRQKVYVQGIENVKRDGTKVFIPLHPSNLLIVGLDIDDKIRRKVIERK